MKKNRGLRLSIKTKILIGSIIINIIVCAVMGIAIYSTVNQSYVKSAAKNTLSICQIAAKQLNGNLLGLLEAGADESYANTVMREDMAVVADSASISAIYTAGERGGSMVYLSTPASDGISIGTPVAGASAENMKAAMSSGGYVSTTVEKNAAGVDYITAYAPITNKAGDVVGVLGIDYIVDDLVKSLKVIVEKIIIIAIIMAVISAVISAIMANGIGYGLGVVDKKITDLVNNNGDLTQKIEVKGNDEVSDIADSINELLEYIRGVVHSIFDSSNKLSGSVETALDTTVRTNDQLDGVSATMEQMSAAMEETAASLAQVQGSTNKIKEDVQGMYTSVREGTDYASEMEQRAKEMRKHAEEETEAAKIAADNMTEGLNDKIEKSRAVEQISGLTQTILEIASQTNLLSLNASIEAARAGEHGKGFAVVAGEISSLATSSADTAKKIQVISEEVIGNVKELADEATKMVDFVRDKTIGGYQQLMDTGVQYQDDAQKISEMLRNVENASQNIENSMNFVSQAMSDVATAVDESAKGIGDVAGAVTEMSDNMKENKAVVNENAQIAQQLDGEVNKFKF
ncbi:methyl-accepting chemotaxis protein [Butyrivibrio sp. VCB2006]|uniref:methyl-accepting chemotaxis protein n=1 Tax=Butyrivibrio sp. VCB2006 TaxID=1280679 RepID=UPI000415FE6D|nr:methyl-accepting chemotaxis protein [Butyrivibrio sp. VCB2006]